MKKVVIIEDNEIVARLYENKLKAAGNTVHVAMNGKEGLDLIYNIKPNLVLLDLMLPEMSGVEIIKAIRKDHRYSSVPIMAYSSADEDVLEQAAEAGSTTVVSKNRSSLKEILEQFNELMESTRGWHIYNPEHFKDERKAEEKENGGKTTHGQILVVEDDLLVAKLIKDIIEKAGFAPVVIHDGQEAMRLLASEANFNAAILDVELPKIKGTDLLKYMRTEKRLQYVPTMVMTAAENSVRMQLESYDAGATFFVPKPFERSLFETLLKSLIRVKS